jgi:AcrR family transcriptional regulator
MPPRRTTSRDPEVTRALLIGAAQKEFNTRGFFGTDTNRIARRAGFAPQTFYRHFEDKIAIFVAVYEVWWRAELAALGDLPGRPVSRSDARRAAVIIADFHIRWRIFRRSLRHLSIEEPRVRGARTAARLAQIERLQAIAPKKRKLETIISVLLVSERICDAIADGEIADLGLSKSAALALVAGSIATLTGRPG